MKKIILGVIALALTLPASAQWTNLTNINNTNTGNVGVGKNAPTVLLTVGNDNGNGTTDLQRPLALVNGASLSPANGSAVGLAFAIGNNNNPAQKLGTIDVFNEYFNINASMRFSTVTGSSLTEKMRIDATGNVGIGTTNPGRKLDILASAGVTPLAAVGANGYLLIDNVGSGQSFYQANAFHQFQGTSGNPIMTLFSTGNVGIGTTQPDAKLTVNGTIHSTEVKVTATVPPPDYVFDPAYKLPKLSELKTYLDDNHHLPEIPSASDIEKNGINLSEMNLKLLKKVEELTLYAIEAKKESDELKSQNAKLKQSLENINVILSKNHIQ
ncbi:hypothetical protein [Mucilaginibacter sp. UR6-11]|uniref:hypothetical protein n=1 Tax=Mucilaginibacter sp. UR6-11 TaxID=1435644 RepID=UPI001E35E6A0|nr:hypothetical protein [Mucilaginibacter sp. UR6-11]MCC8427251.1 hypothetical protein [Mucilaginibacter sp. UR6-11]